MFLTHCNWFFMNTRAQPLYIQVPFTPCHKIWKPKCIKYFVHRMPEEFDKAKTILHLSLNKTRAEEYHNYCNIIDLEKLCFKVFFPFIQNVNMTFSNFSGWKMFSKSSVFKMFFSLHKNEKPKDLNSFGFQRAPFPWRISGDDRLNVTVERKLCFLISPS